MNTSELLDVALASIPDRLRDEVMMGLAQTDPVRDRKDACGFVDGDYLGTDRDGVSVYFCHVCGEPREYGLLGADGEMHYFPIEHRHDLKAKQEAERQTSIKDGLEAAKRECYGNALPLFGNAAMVDVEAPESVRNDVSAFLSDKLNVENGRGLIVCGPNGAGKSWLAAAVCNDLMAQGRSCRFATLSQLVDSIGIGESERALRELCRHDLVVIDDLGAERDSSYMTEQGYNVINALYVNRKSVIVTTNLTPKQIASPTSEYAKKVMGRLKERSHMVVYDAPDKRQGRL